MDEEKYIFREQNITVYPLDRVLINDVSEVFARRFMTVFLNGSMTTYSDAILSVTVTRSPYSPNKSIEITGVPKPQMISQGEVNELRNDVFHIIDLVKELKERESISVPPEESWD